MDVKRMHCMIEKLAECAEKQFDNGIESVDTAEMGQVTDMLKDLAEAMYYRTLTKAMDDSDPEEIMEMFERYGDGGRRYYDHYRYADGRFAPKGHGTYRKGYEETPYWHMTPEDYHSWESKPEAERRRDLDRMQGRMFFSEPVNEGKYEHARRNYTETKNTKNEEESNMRGLEMLLNVVDEDIKEFMPSMSQAERAMTKSKLSTWAQRL